MKKIIVALFAFSALYMSSCKTDSSDPKTVLTSFYDAMAKKDIAAARKLATADSKQMFDLIEMGMKSTDSEMDDEFKELFDKSNVEFGETKIDGNKATVNVKQTKSGESVNIVLKKESGSWKVAVDLNTMKGMASEKMKETGMSEEEIRKMEEEMQNINLDSIKTMVEQAKRVRDSIKASLNQK